MKCQAIEWNKTHTELTEVFRYYDLAKQVVAVHKISRGLNDKNQWKNLQI